MSNQLHLKGLNGIRAIAALSVLVYHAFTRMDWFGLDRFAIWGELEPTKPHSFRVGVFAVTVFFALSGFLITYLLLKEYELKKDINVGKFYMRRILRIWPLYFLLIPVSLGVYKLLDFQYPPSSIVYYLLLIANVALYLKVPIPLLGGYWSVCVEEQFYLVWPLFMKFSKNRYFRNTLILLAVLMALRVVFNVLQMRFPILAAYNELMGQSRYHVLLMGALAAMLYVDNNQMFIKIFSNKYVVLAAWIFIFLPVIKGFRVLGQHEVMALSTIVIIVSQIRNQNKLINLENKVFDFLGKISYGIYMFHPLVLFLLGKSGIWFAHPQPWNYAIVVVLVTAITILVSTLSYYYFEGWFLNLKKKYTVIEDSGFRKQ